MLGSLLLGLLALQSSPTPPDGAARASALHERGTTAFNQGDASQAVSLFEQAAALDASLGPERKPSLARDWASLGLCLSALGRTDEAVARLKTAIELWRALDLPAETVVSLEQLAVVEFSHSRLDGAQAHLEEALQLARAHAPGVVPGLLSNLGMVLQAMGRDAEALARYQEVLQESDNALDSAKTLGNIANLHLVAGRLSQAEAVYQQAQAAFERAGDTASVTTTAINLGMVCLAQGKYDEARAALEGGLERARRDKLSLLQASAELHLAHVFEATGLFDEAERSYRESLQLFRGLDNPQNSAAALSGLGSLYLSWGRGDNALALAEEALALGERHQIPDQILGSLELLGNAERIGGRFNTAILHLRRALALAEQLQRAGDQARIASELGAAFFCWGKTQEAETHFREALASAERLGQGHAIAQGWIHLGGVRQVAGDLQGARDSYLHGLELSRAAGTRPDEATALTNLGTLALGGGDRRAAERYFLEAIALDERFRLTASEDDRPSALAPWLSSYRWLIQLHFLDGDASAVLDASERIKARHLADRISARTRAPEPDPPGLETFRRELAPSVAIVSFANVDWQYPVAVVATSAVIQTYALKAVDGAAGGPAEPDGSVSALSPGAMRRSFALAARLAEYRELLALAEPSPAQRTRRDTLARELCDSLLGPARGALRQAEQLVIIPDGSLSLIPFETLRLPDGRYLVERYHVTYEPSLRVMQLLRRRRHVRHARSLLAIGGAPYRAEAAVRVAGASAQRAMSALQWEALRTSARRHLESGKGAAEVYAALGRGGWSELPGARAEVEAIGRIVPRSMVLSGAAVSEAKLKALSRSGILREFETLHFATHGLTVTEAPELSALVLAEAGRAGEQGEDGYLSVEEISRLDLQPDFVNLAACDSGLGRIYGGEGPVGLTQAFLEAGANGVSVSLWQIHDAFSRDFMVGLYRRVRQRGLSHARAMTAMKRAFIRQGKVEPFFWAPFVYYGKD